MSLVYLGLVASGGWLALNVVVGTVQGVVLAVRDLRRR